MSPAPEGTGYRNPVIPGFHPDPSACRWRDEYVLATSSFTYFPGVPIFTSPDLVMWKQVGNALERTSQLDLEATSSSSRGIYAPTIRHHDDKLWMITTVLRDHDLVMFFVTADRPEGPWSDPVPVDLRGIDPDLSWDDEGNCWIHYGVGNIQRARIDDRTGIVLEGPEQTWSGTGLKAPEAPHLFRRGSWWYLMIAEGGTERGHGVSIARGPSPRGPWHGCPANPIVSHRSTDSPIQNTGHADLVEARDGTWWMVLLGVRPLGKTPMFHVLGRETFLTPVDWEDEWPVPQRVALEMPNGPTGTRSVETAPTRDDFADRTIHHCYVTVRRPLGDAMSLKARPGWLVLNGGEDGLDAARPVFVGRRQTAHWCRARTLVEAGDAAEAGLAVRMDETAHYEVALSGESIVVRARIGPLSHVVAEETAPKSPIVLRLETRDVAGRLDGPDIVSLGYDDASGSFRALADLDGRYLSTEVATGFIGRVIGLYAVNGSAAFDWFELQEL